MKRYIAEMENDFERKIRERNLSADDAERDVLRLQKIRNAYLIGILTEVDAVHAMLQIVLPE